MSSEQVQFRLGPQHPGRSPDLVRSKVCEQDPTSLRSETKTAWSTTFSEAGHHLERGRLRSRRSPTITPWDKFGSSTQQPSPCEHLKDTSPARQKSRAGDTAKRFKRLRHARKGRQMVSMVNAFYVCTLLIPRVNLICTFPSYARKLVIVMQEFTYDY